MPQVPDVLPDVQPSLDPLPEARIPVSPEAFGGQVGQSLQHLGVQVEHVGDQLFSRALQIQSDVNETDAKNADAAAAGKYEELYTNMASKEGINASGYLPEYKQKLNEARLAVRGGLKNDAARRMYDANSLQNMIRVMFAGARHANSQLRTAEVKSSQALMQSSIDTIRAHPEDSDGVQHQLDTIKKQAETIGGKLGWMRPQIDEYKRQSISEAYGEQILGLSKRDVGTATTLYNQNQALLTPEMDTKVQAGLRTQTHQVVPRLAAEKVLDKIYRAKTLDDVSITDPTQLAEEAKALPEVQAAMKNDPTLEPIIEQTVATDYHRIIGEKKEFEQANYRALSKALQTPAADGITFPTNLKETIATGGPEMETIFNNLDGDDQKKVRGIWLANAKGENTPPTPWNITNYAHWMGIASAHQGSVQDQAEFLDQKFPLDTRFTNAQRQRLALAQQEFKASQSAFDPKVGRAMEWLLHSSQNAALQSLHLDRYTKAWSKDYYKFQSGLHDMLEAFESDNGKPATEKDVIEKIGPALLSTHTVPGRLWGTNEAPTFRDVPKDFSDATKQKFLDRGLPPPTPELLQKAYNAYTLTKLYPPTKSTEKAPSNQPKPFTASSPATPPPASQ